MNDLTFPENRVEVRPKNHCTFTAYDTALGMQPTSHEKYWCFLALEFLG